MVQLFRMFPSNCPTKTWLLLWFLVGTSLELLTSSWSFLPPAGPWLHCCWVWSPFQSAWRCSSASPNDTETCPEKNQNVSKCHLKISIVFTDRGWNGQSRIDLDSQPNGFSIFSAGSGQMWRTKSHLALRLAVASVKYIGRFMILPWALKIKHNDTYINLYLYIYIHVMLINYCTRPAR